MKLLPISNCNQCFYLYVNYVVNTMGNYVISDMKCMKLNKVIPIQGVIPEWCPLNDEISKVWEEKK